MKEETTIIILHESVLHSWLKDGGSLGALAALIYVNHTYGSGNWFIDTIGGVLLLAFLLARGKMAANTHRFTRDDLRRWALNEDANL